MSDNTQKTTTTLKVVIAILIVFLIIEIVPIIIGIVKSAQGDPKAYGYILLPSVSLISTVVIAIPAIFIMRAYAKKELKEEDNDEISND